MTQEINITTAGFGEAMAYVINAHTDACNKFPSWPVDQVYATAILAEESGETVQAALRHHWDSGSLNEIIMEAAQTGAMAIRVIQGALLAQAEAGDQRKYVDWCQMAPEKVVATRSFAMVLDAICMRSNVPEDLKKMDSKTVKGPEGDDDMTDAKELAKNINQSYKNSIAQVLWGMLEDTGILVPALPPPWLQNLLASALDAAEQRGRDNAYRQLEAVYQDEYPEGEYLDKKSWKLIRSTLKGELT